MITVRQLALCIPSAVITFVFGFIPWGLIAVAITLVLYGFILFMPSKSLVKLNVNTALEGLTYREFSAAKDHVEIALREAERSTALSPEDIELLRSACDKVASALIVSGQPDAGHALREHGNSVIARLAQRN